MEGRGEKEPSDSHVTMFIPAPLAEDPSAVQVLEILRVDPPGRLVRVPSASPPPQTVVDGLVDFLERGRTGAIPVLICPTSNDGIEHCYQVPSFRLFVGLDGSADFGEECFHIPLGRLS